MRCGDTADELRGALIASAERYGWAERWIDGLWKVGGGFLAGALGAHLFSLHGVGLAVGLGVNAAARNLFGPTPLDQWVASQQGLLSDPTFVRVVRAAADSFDELVAGARGVPGYGAFGQLVGAPESASVLLGITALLGTKVLVDGPVSVTRAIPGRRRTARGTRRPPPCAWSPLRPVSATSPTGCRRATGPRSASNATDGPTNPAGWSTSAERSSRHSLQARNRSTTRRTSFGIADDSWIDELRTAGAESGAGERAVRQAMAEAGVAPGDPVMPVGHSGGGIIATRLAADPELNVVGAVNLGGPVVSAPTSEGVPVLSIEHDEDIVPAVGGSGHPSDERLTVSRSVLEEGRAYDIRPARARTGPLSRDGRAGRRVRRAAPAGVPRTRGIHGRRHRCGDRMEGDPRGQLFDGRTMSPMSQLMSPSTRAPSTPHQKLSTTSPKPSRPLIQSTSSSSRPFTMNEMRPSVST